MSVKVLDAGGDILFSGTVRAEVEAYLNDHVARGAKVITPLSQVGRSWVAACRPSAAPGAADRTSTLSLSEIAKAQEKIQAPPKTEPVSDGICSIEKVGFKRLITGPSEAAVQEITRRFLEFGAGIVSPPEESFGQWVAVCDVGGKIAKDPAPHLRSADDDADGI
jgi:hypothetical protein